VNGGRAHPAGRPDNPEMRITRHLWQVRALPAMERPTKRRALFRAAQDGWREPAAGFARLDG